jgi:hypothetical protein
MGGNIGNKREKAKNGPLFLASESAPSQLIQPPRTQEGGVQLESVAIGKRAEAIQVIKELEAMSGASLDQAQWIAKIYAALNENDRALTWLERGLAAGALGALYKDDPVWDAISGYSRFGE